MKRTLRLFLLVQIAVCVFGAVGCGGDESKNECAEENDIRMAAIRDKCAEGNFAGCCYCGCELNVPPAGCDCTSWTLTKDVDVSTCDPAQRGAAIGCINDEFNCVNSTKSWVAIYCR